MATSSSTDFALTRDEIITEAMERIGVLGESETATDASITSAARSLNIMIKALHADPFIDLTFRDTQTLSLVDGTTSYALASDTRKVLRVWLRIDGVDYPLNVVSEQTYDLTASKSSENQPQQVYIDYAEQQAYFYPTPNDSYTAHYRRERLVEDFDASTDDADFPVEASDMLVDGLAAYLAEKFQLPPQERVYWQNKATQSKQTYKAGRTNRTGREIVRPNFIV